MKILEQYDHIELTTYEREILELAIEPDVLDLLVNFDMGHYNGYSDKEAFAPTCCMLGRLHDHVSQNKLPKYETIIKKFKAGFDLVDSLRKELHVLYTPYWQDTMYNESRYIEHLYKYSLLHGVMNINRLGSYSTLEPYNLSKLMEELLQLNPLGGS